MHTIEQPMTVEAFDALPESVLPHQYIRGHLIVSPPPNRFHQRLAGELFVEISLFLRAHPALGEVYQAPFEVRLKGPEGEERYQPDVMFFARAHLDRLTDQCAVGVPDLVIEVLSPKTARYDRNEKRLGYAQNGAAELWIIDPKRKTAEVYRFSADVGRPPKVLKPGDVLSTGLLPGFELALSHLFG
ncbi:MAG: Uma2 family endonuclease [Verrucomicrobia bacterium]|nr:Uma2 family endonuclease [Verrucomicrobiota bacterium]